MAETAKVLIQTYRGGPGPRRQLQLVESCRVEDVRAYRRSHPDHVIVSYINTSVEVKAEATFFAPHAMPSKLLIPFPPIKRFCSCRTSILGNYVKRQTGRENMKIWQGACIVHATFMARRLAKARAEHPSALVASHPECTPDVLAMSDFIGSTTAIIQWCASSEADEFIVMTESGVLRSLQKLAPHKRFHFIPNENCNCSECPYMKRNTLEKLRECLRTLEPRVELSAEIMQRAALPLSACWR